MKTSTLIKETATHIVEKRLTKNKDNTYTLSIPKTLDIFLKEFSSERVLHFTQWGYRQVMDKKHLSKGLGALDKDTIISLPDKALREMSEIMKAQGKDIDLVAKKKHFLDKDKEKNVSTKNGKTKNGNTILRKKATSENGNLEKATSEKVTSENVATT